MSTTPEDVKRLAALARIHVADKDLPKFAAEFDSILAYVGKLDSLSISMGDAREKPAVRNVFREDGEPTPKGTYTQKLVEQFPEKKDNLLSVKQIISHD